MRNENYHAFTPGGIEPAFILALILGLAIIAALSFFIVRIRPIDSRVRRYRSVGNKATRVADSHRRTGAAPKGEEGLAIIMPSTSFDWGLAVIYAIYAVVLANHYHGAGILQLLWNHGYTEFAFIVLMMLGGALTMPFVILIARFAQFVSAKKLFLSSLRSDVRLHVYEEWGLYDKVCHKEFDAIVRTLARKEKCAVRAVVSDPNISERTKLDRAESFIIAQTNLKRKTRPKDFENILDSFVEYVYDLGK